MKPGSTLQNIAQRLNEQRTASIDLLVQEPAITMTAGGAIAVPETPAPDSFQGNRSFPPKLDIVLDPTPLAHRQIGTHLGIPAPYYDRMRTDAPELLAGNVNRWLADHTDGVRMLRTLTPTAEAHRHTLRAFLSNRYRPLDNYDLAQAVLPELDANGFALRSHELTDTHLYLKAVLEERTVDVAVGDAVAIGVSIRNSDVGCSSLSIAPFIERLICTNGMTINDLGTRRRHVGKRLNGFQDGALIAEHLSTEAHAASDKAFWLAARDTARACASEATLATVADSMRQGREIRATGHPQEVVRQVSRRVGITEGEESSVLEHLITGGELSAYGLANAVTRAAADVESYDRASELEAIGWQVLQLPAQSFAA